MTGEPKCSLGKQLRLLWKESSKARKRTQKRQKLPMTLCSSSIAFKQASPQLHTQLTFAMLKLMDTDQYVHTCVDDGHLTSQEWCEPLLLEHRRLVPKVLRWPRTKRWLNSVLDVLGVNRHKGNRGKASLLHQCGHSNLHHWSITDCIVAGLDLIPTSLLPPQIILTLKRYTKTIQSTQPFILHQILLRWNTISILQTQMLWGACFCMSCID